MLSMLLKCHNKLGENNELSGSDCMATMETHSRSQLKEWRLLLEVKLQTTTHFIV